MKADYQRSKPNVDTGVTIDEYQHKSGKIKVL